MFQRTLSPAARSRNQSTLAAICRAPGWWWTCGIAAMLVLGGGSSTIPLTRILAELIAVPMCTYGIFNGNKGRGIRLQGSDWLVLSLFGLLITQLIPLPGSVWSSLPHRQLLAAIDRTVFGELRWRALTIVPAETVRAMLFLLPPLAGYVAVGFGDATRRNAVFRGVAIAAAVSVGLASAQVMAPEASWLHPYPLADYPLPIGFFTNRNHQADFLLCSLPLVLAWLWRVQVVRPGGSATGQEWLAPVLAGISVILVAATASRAGVALILPTLILTFLALWLGHLPMRTIIRRLAMLIAAFAAISLVLYVLGGERLVGAIARGEIADDNRFKFWPTVWAAAAAYWPWGAGIGTFRQAYEMIEPIGGIRELYVNHAHNDYLEICIEGGIPALLLLGATIAWIVRSAFNAWRTPTSVETRLATVSLTIVLAHSLLDYPARTIAIATTCAVALALTRRPFRAAECHVKMNELPLTN